MSNALITNSTLSDFADAIRAKNGTQDTYTPGEMAAAISAIPSGGGGGGIDLLWTNSNTTVQFAAQTVSLDLSSYGAVAIQCNLGIANGERGTYTLADVPPDSTNIGVLQLVPKGTDAFIEFGSLIAKSSSTLATVGYRKVTVSNSGVTFGAGYYKQNGYDTSEYNGRAIPVKIYGIKGTFPS